jgi:AcrR family transcriptional regulator
MPRVVDAEQRRAELVELTAGEIARSGLEQLTLRGLARAGGWTTGVVNHYFVDKRDLLVATFRSRADVAWRRTESEMASGASPLEAIVEGALPVDEERLANWKVWMAFWGAAIGDDDLTAVQLERYRSFLAAVERALEMERKQGRIRDDVDIARQALLIVALLDGVGVQATFHPQAWPPAEQRQIFKDHFATLRP